MKYVAIALCVLLAGCTTTETSGVSVSDSNSYSNSDSIPVKYDRYVKPKLADVIQCGIRFRTRYIDSKRDAMSLNLALRSYCSSELYAYRKGSELYYGQSPLSSSADKTMNEIIDAWSAKIVGSIIQQNL